MTSAARISKGSLASEVWKAAAVPWKLASMVGGKLMARCALLIASVAWPKDTLGARLNDNVTAGYWPWWLTAKGVLEGPK